MMLSNDARTLLLVGRTGNGKSATGNTILGGAAFKSKASSSGVTSTCELQKTMLENRKIINVIDTPGFFNTSTGIDNVGKEMVKCIDLAKDGIHAILVVLSIQTHFSEEEEVVIHTLKTLFGSTITNYMIFVFTGGDRLEDDGETLDEYLSHECPQPLKDILTQCGNRKVLFDNKTRNRSKRIMQVQELLSLVDMVINQNDGKPYSGEMFDELKKGAMKLHEQQEAINSLKGYNKVEILKLQAQVEEQKLVEEQATKKWAEEHAQEQMKLNVEVDNLKKRLEEVEAKLKEQTIKLEQKLAEEQVTKKSAEEHIQEAQMKSDAEIGNLRKSLEEVEAKLRETIVKLEQKLADEQVVRKRVEEHAQEAQMKSNAEIDNVEAKLRETTIRLEQKLAEEQATRKRVEEHVQEAQMKSNAKIDNLRKTPNEVEAKLREMTIKLEQKLVKEQAARNKAEEHVQEAEMKSNAKLNHLRKSLEEVDLKHKETTIELEQKLAEVQRTGKWAEKLVQEAQMKLNVEIVNLSKRLENACKKMDELCNSII